MIKAYLTWISTPFEGEPIEIRYRIFEDEVLLFKESIILDYKKPSIVGHVAVMELLDKLEEFSSHEIVIIVNDGSLYESIRGTSATKNRDVQIIAKEVREELSRFDNVVVENVSGNHIRLSEWNEILAP